LGIADCGLRADRGLRIFWLTLFAIGAAAVLVFGWQMGEPWTAAAFVVFFASRAVRSVIKWPRVQPMESAADDGVRRANRFILITAAGYLGAGLLAGVAAVAGEGQEWLYVAPCFLVMGALNLYVFCGAWPRAHTPTLNSDTKLRH
jgi:hypothetical protein